MAENDYKKYDKVPLNVTPTEDATKVTPSPVDQSVGEVDHDRKFDPVLSKPAPDAAPPTFWQRQKTRLVNSVKNDVKNLVLPTLKTMVYTAVCNTARSIILPNTPAASMPNVATGSTVLRPGGSFTRYDKITPTTTQQTTGPSVITSLDLPLDTREDAELVLGRLQEIVDQYRFVSTRDLYEIIDRADMIKPIDDNWGWNANSMKRAYISPGANGQVILKLPKRMSRP